MRIRGKVKINLGSKIEIEVEIFLVFVLKVQKAISHHLLMETLKMAAETKQILKYALDLPPKERVELIDRLISSLDQPDEKIDRLWRKEVESRIDAYQAGKIKSVTLERVLSKYQK